MKRKSIWPALLHGLTIALGVSAMIYTGFSDSQAQIKVDDGPITDGVEIPLTGVLSDEFPVLLSPLWVKDRPNTTVKYKVRCWVDDEVVDFWATTAVILPEGGWQFVVGKNKFTMSGWPCFARDIR